MPKITFERKGLVFKVDNINEKLSTHAQVPFGYQIENDTLRVYFATRNTKGCSQVSYVEVDSLDISNIKYIQKDPVLEPGALGMFDDRGTMPSWFIEDDERLLLYYTAWNLGGNIPYRLSIGLAISEDSGKTFSKYKNAPILDRSETDPFWVAQPCVMKCGRKWRMWYLSCTKWEIINNYPEPFYHVKYGESDDGIHWEATGDISVDYDEFTNAIGRPSVYYGNNLYKMIYSYRSAVDYRNDPGKSYRLGYAESTDGIHFIRKDDAIQFTGEKQEWEYTMQEYSHVFQCDGQIYLIYNGNGFGKSGFGYAMVEDDSQ